MKSGCTVRVLWVNAPDTPDGEVPEWSNGTVSKTVVLARVPRVRIPVSPPVLPYRRGIFHTQQVHRQHERLARFQDRAEELSRPEGEGEHVARILDGHAFAAGNGREDVTYANGRPPLLCPGDIGDQDVILDRLRSTGDQAGFDPAAATARTAIEQAALTVRCNPKIAATRLRACPTFRVLFDLPLQQSTGFVESLSQLVGLELAVPDFRTFCRRQRTRTSAYHIAVDPDYRTCSSTALASRPKAKANGTLANMAARSGAFGALKLKAIDEERQEVRAVEVTSGNVGNALMLPVLLGRIPPDQDIGSITADRAYDTRKCLDAIASRGA